MMYEVAPISPQRIPLLSSFSGAATPAVTLWGVGCENWIAVAAHAGLDCVGVAAATIDNDPGSKACVVRTILVNPLHRRRTLGTALMRCLEEEVQRNRCSLLRITVVGNAMPRLLAALLRKCDWPPLLSTGLFCVSDYDRLSQAQWMKYKKLPGASVVFPWEDLTSNDRNEIRLKSQDGRLPPALNPLDAERSINHKASVGLRHNGKVSGWCIFCNTLSGDNVCSSLFIESDLVHHGYSIGLAARSIDALGKSSLGRIIFDVSFQNTAMIYFLRRGVAPHLTSMKIIRKSEKQLGPEIVFPT